MPSAHRFADFGLPARLFSCSVSVEDRRGNSRSQCPEGSGTATKRNPPNNLLRGLARELHRDDGVAPPCGIQTLWGRSPTSFPYTTPMLSHSTRSPQPVAP